MQVEIVPADSDVGNQCVLDIINFPRNLVFVRFYIDNMGLSEVCDHEIKVATSGPYWVLSCLNCAYFTEYVICSCKGDTEFIPVDMCLIGCVSMELDCSNT